MSIRPLNDEVSIGENQLIQRSKFKNPTISDMASPDFKGNDDPAIMNFSDMGGDEYFIVPDNLSEDPRYYLCTCHLRNEQQPCTCRFNPQKFNRAMFEMARTKDGIYWDFCYQECMKLTEENNFTEKTLMEVYDKIVQIILEDNLFLKTVMG